MRQIVIFDTNAYRELFQDKTLKECLDLIDSIKKKEIELGIQAYIVTIVWLELFAHLADIDDAAFDICLNSICGSYLHAAINRIDYQYKNLIDADDIVAKFLFNCDRKDTQRVFKSMNLMAREIFKNPDINNIIKHKDFFNGCLKAIEKEERKFKAVYNEVFSQEIKENAKEREKKLELKNFIGTNSYLNQLAENEVKKAVYYASIDATRLTEVEIRKYIDFVKSYFSAPLWLSTEILKDGLFQKDLDINKKNRVNWCWDYKILFCISKLTPYLLITRDKAMIRAANSAGLGDKVKNIDEYKNMINL